VRLNDIALKPGVVSESTEAYIDLLIESEKMDK